MIVEIFVAQRQRVDPLPDQLPDPVFDAVGIAAVLKAGRKPRQQIDASIDLAQQQRAAVGADRPAVKLALAWRPECLANEKLDGLHSVTAGLLVFCGDNVFSINVLCRNRQPFPCPLVRYPR